MRRMLRAAATAAFTGAVMMLGATALAEDFPMPGTGVMPDCDTSRSQQGCPQDGAGGNGPIPGAPGLEVGVCGPADGTTQSDQPTGAAACSSGTFQNRPNTSTLWRWDCEGGGSGESAFCTADRPAPPSVMLSASPTSVADGESTTLTWTVSNATSCTREGDWSGFSNTSGGSSSQGPLSAGETYTYTLTCDNGNGQSDTASASVSVEEEEPDVSVSLSASPSTIEEGDESTLSWTAENAERCELAGVSGASDGVSGSVNVSPDETTTYEITCFGDDTTNSDSDTASVTVDAPAPDPEVSITAEQLGDQPNVEVSWTATDAEQCTASGDWSGPRDASGGSITYENLEDTTYTFTITCDGVEQDQEASDTATVVLEGPPPSNSGTYFNIVEEEVQSGHNMTVEWNVAGYEGVSWNKGEYEIGGVRSEDGTTTCSGVLRPRLQSMGVANGYYPSQGEAITTPATQQYEAGPNMRWDLHPPNIIKQTEWINWGCTNQDTGESLIRKEEVIYVTPPDGYPTNVRGVHDYSPLVNLSVLDDDTDAALFVNADNCYTLDTGANRYCELKKTGDREFKLWDAGVVEGEQPNQEYCKFRCRLD